MKMNKQFQIQLMLKNKNLIIIKEILLVHYFNRQHLQIKMKKPMLIKKISIVHYFKHKLNKNKIVKFHNNKDKNDYNQIVNYKILNHFINKYK